MGYLSIEMLHLNQTPFDWNQTSGYRDMNISLKFLNNEKHKKLSPLLACNIKLNTSDIQLIPFDHVTNVWSLRVS